jgi:hypothetical protein
LWGMFGKMFVWNVWKVGLMPKESACFASNNVKWLMQDSNLQVLDDHIYLKCLGFHGVFCLALTLMCILIS